MVPMQTPACLDDDAIVAYFGNGTGRGAWEDHVDDCDSCRGLLAAVVRQDNSRGAREWRVEQQVDRFVLRERIGRGAMGTVWRAEDVELGREVAVKRLHSGDHAQLVDEARSAAQLQHPNVVALYEVIADEHAPFLVMELVAGVTMRQWLGDAKRSVREIIEVLAQAGRGLAAAHARGLVHRDFKPDNILVDADGRARVADFGLASADGARGAQPPACKLACVTAIGCGTPAYMAPELVAGSIADVRSDVYAFAVTAYEALHGHHPFTGSDAETLWIEMAAGRIRTGKRRIPARIDRALRRGLAVDPADRWADIASFVAAIEPRRSSGRYVAAGVGLAALIAAGAFWMRAPGAADDCERGAALAPSVWNPLTRSAISGRFTVAAAARCQPTAAAAGELLDHWVGSWQLGRRAACTASDHPAPRIACLDRQLDEVRSQIGLWMRASADDVDHAVSAARALPRVTECSTARAVTASVVPLLARTSEVTVLWRSGHAREAQPKLAPLLADLALAGDPGASAAALLVAAGIEEDLLAMDAAIEHVTRAAAEASKAGDDNLLFQALIVGAMLKTETGHALDALGMCDAAEAVAARGLPTPERVYTARGGALLQLDRPSEAIVQYQRAVDALEPAADRDALARGDLGLALAGLGEAYLTAKDASHALTAHTRALALTEATRGSRHPDVGRMLLSLARDESALSRYDEAAKHIQRGREILLAALGSSNPEVAEADLGLATIALFQGRLDEGRTLLESARDRLAVSNENTQTMAFVESQLGTLDERANDCAAALPHYQRELEILLETHVEGNDLAQAEIDLANCFVKTGRMLEAKARAEAALEGLIKANAADSDRVMPWMILALAAEHRDRQTAIGFARQVVAATSDADAGERAEARTLMQAKLRTWTAR